MAGDRALQAYIQDIRNCSTKEAEKERVDKELGKIRKKYTSDKAMTGVGRPPGRGSQQQHPRRRRRRRWRTPRLGCATTPLPPPAACAAPARSLRQAQVHVEASVHPPAGL
jgi:hypothetical protein